MTEPVAGTLLLGDLGLTSGRMENCEHGWSVKKYFAVMCIQSSDIIVREAGMLGTVDCG